MKYLVASDIHGSLFYAKKIIDIFERENFDKLLLLGDILYHGPRNDLPKEYNPKEVAKLLNQYKNEIICVKGNCDTEVDQMVLEFPIVDLACVEINNKSFYLTHGHKFSNESPLNVEKSIVLYGHTHKARVDEVRGSLYINPGSTSIPKDEYGGSYIEIVDNKIKMISFDKGLFNEVTF